MGKKSKVGKQRKDKYYHLAKETGFRSRAAFKLIQLNRKFEFLQKARVCIDLCAAPGGWSQVAQQNMPVSSIIIGVDMYPYKPIPGCINLVEDITTDKCKVALGKELQSWKADVILNDGAPNVGKNWAHDAYQQCCLTLSALKLATQFLRKGGWFITKVFRSQDYHALIWVLKQLFKKVHATKPQASRTESAEIFVVCKYYIAPDKIDPKFLDSKHVFSELNMESSNKLNIFHPEKTKAKVEGYAENDYTLFHTLPVSQFIQHKTGVELLEQTTEIVFDDEQIKNHESTTKEIIACCKDLKVLGRKDLRALLKWRQQLHDESKADEEEPEKPDEDEKKESEDEEELLKKQIEELNEEEMRELKRKKKKALKERKKLNERLNLKMVLKNDQGPTVEADEMFNLKSLANKHQIDTVIDQAPDLLADPDSDDEEHIIKKKYEKYEKDGGHLDSKGLYYKDSDSELEMESDYEDPEEELDESLGFSDSADDEDEDESPKKETKTKSKGDHPLITDLDYRSKEQKRAHKAEMWFERDAFKSLVDENDEDADLDKMIEKYEGEGVKVKEKKGKAGKITKEIDRSKPQKASDSDYSTDNSDTDSDDSDYNVNQELRKRTKNVQGGIEIVKPDDVPKRKLTVEDLALGTMMVNSKKTKRDLIDGAWNRYAFNDTNLPSWFVEDEQKHTQKLIPETKEMVEEYRKQLQELNVRPIKKIVEAKARKKKTAIKKLEKAKKKIEALMDNVDVTDKEKTNQIKQLYQKAHKKPKKEITYVVAKKHLAGKRTPRPAGVKGNYKVVDPRMKKDLKALKNKQKKVRKSGSQARKSARGGKKSKPRRSVHTE